MANDETISASRKDRWDFVSNASTTYFLNTKLDTMVVASRIENSALDNTGKVGLVGIAARVFPK